METIDQFWNTIVQHFRFADALDLAAGTILLTLFFHWLRNRSARVVIFVICLTALFYLTAHALRMYLMMAAFRMGLWVMLFAFIVVFQDDIRSGFEQITTWPPFPFARKKRRDLSVETLSNAVELLAKERSGALIVLPARQSLERLLQGGETVNGQLSVPLLHSIFHSGSLGHDGAVVVKDNHVWKLGVHLPLSTNFELIGSRGTRHAAALGLAERSDALVIVVSEERGEVSIAQNRRLTTLSPPAQIRDFLQQSHQHSPPASWSARLILPWARSLALGAMAFLIVGFFWYLVAQRVEQIQRIVDNVPIETHNIPPGWVVESTQPEEVRVNLTGSERAFEAYNWSQLKIRVDLSELESGRQSVVLSEESIKLPQEMQVQEIEPNVIQVTAYETQLMELPVAVQTKGPLPEGVSRNNLIASPSTVSVRVRSSQVSQIQEIPTQPVELSELQLENGNDIPLVFPPNVVPAEETPTFVRVSVQRKEANENQPETAPQR